VLLDDILPKNDTIDDYEIEHNFESIGQKTILLNACKIAAKENEPPIILLAIEDVTEREWLEGLLTDSEERSRRLFETASDGIVLLEKREGHITHANQAVEKLLGYPEEEYIGKKLRDIGVSIDMSDFPAIIRNLDKHGIMHYDDVQVMTKSGESIDTDIYMVDRATLIQCNIRDITKHKKSSEALRSRTEELETVNKELGAFIYSAAHDLRAPLRSIQ
jgi:PAS domain S-box-containing protein